MPVDARAFVGDVVVDLDFDVVAPIGLSSSIVSFIDMKPGWTRPYLYSRARVLVVRQHTVHLEPIGSTASLRHSPVVVTGDSSVRCLSVLVGVYGVHCTPWLATIGHWVVGEIVRETPSKGSVKRGETSFVHGCHYNQYIHMFPNDANTDHCLPHQKPSG
jgi:hypothetical protein